jgi:hypothetical protein
LQTWRSSFQYHFLRRGCDLWAGIFLLFWGYCTLSNVIWEEKIIWKGICVRFIEISIDLRGRRKEGKVMFVVFQFQLILRERRGESHVRCIPIPIDLVRKKRGKSCSLYSNSNWSWGKEEGKVMFNSSKFQMIFLNTYEKSYSSECLRTVLCFIRNECLLPSNCLCERVIVSVIVSYNFLYSSQKCSGRWDWSWGLTFGESNDGKFMCALSKFRLIIRGWEERVEIHLRFIMFWSL